LLGMTALDYMPNQNIRALNLTPGARAVRLATHPTNPDPGPGRWITRSIRSTVRFQARAAIRTPRRAVKGGRLAMDLLIEMGRRCRIVSIATGSDTGSLRYRPSTPA
jgi:hypothetical protein